MVHKRGIDEMIKGSELKQSPAAIADGKEEGMQTVKMSLVDLVQSGRIDEADDMAASDNADELKMNLQGIFLSQDRGGILKR